jgi:hypothetical protein
LSFDEEFRKIAGLHVNPAGKGRGPSEN